MATFSLRSEIQLPKPLEEVFAFFADARNLEHLTPPWLHFEVLTPSPIVMQPGTLIDYRIRLHGIPLRWQSEITAWEPPHRFVDEQRKGPYRCWIHQHQFRADGQRTIVTDEVEYATLGGTLINRFFVAPDLERIFTYRRQKLAEIFGE